MSELAIQIRDLGRMYKLYNNRRVQLLDTLGFGALTRKAYKEFWALRHFNLDVKHGERIGLIGRNGAGKSTLLKILCGRSRETEGSVHINGQVQALLGIGTGFNNEFTGRENIHSALSLHGLSAAQIRRHEEEIIDFTELEDFIQQPVKFYSAGMYTRLAFAVATALEPEILIIDEVLGAGDAAFVTKCAARMKRITEESGATVLFVSHSTASVIEICNRAILVERGRIAADGDPLAITKLYHQRIRADEEVSLKAREYRMRRRDLKNLMAEGDRRKFLFRLVVDQSHPKVAHKIYEARLHNMQGDVIAQLPFGAPHDNSEYLDNHVLDAYGLNDWGRASKDKRGTYRHYENAGGKFCHAPFQLSAGLHEDPQTLTLALDTVPGANEAVRVEWFDGQEYRPLGHLSSQFSAPLPAPQPSDEAAAPVVAVPESGLIELEAQPAQAVDEGSIYGSGELRLTNVTLVGGGGQDKRVFETGESMRFGMTLESSVAIPSFTLVLCIYLRDGRPGMQVHVSSADLGLNNFSGIKQVSVVLDPLRLGAGEYMVSLAAFKSYDLTTPREDPAYVVLDRAFFFNVVQPHHMQKSFGGFAQPVTWSSAGLDYSYDPVDWFEGRAG
ncbi:ABC transporter ATP-binding protein [Achromobacter insuavis]|uniref:ABC transporter ATP-binding protein n=2 Tax=Pseudomonadota TaxID=1224 RepID=UPI0015D3A269|nr:ABC transporter ATP-binding protein [Achromobacter insuavis]